MVAYQVNIDDNIPLGKSILALLKSASEAVVLKPIVNKNAAQEKSDTYKRIDRGLKDVRKILDGKQKKQTLKDFLNEV